MLNNFHSIISQRNYSHQPVYQMFKKYKEKRKRKREKPTEKN